MGIFLQKIAGAILVALLLIVGLNVGINELFLNLHGEAPPARAIATGPIPSSPAAVTIQSARETAASAPGPAQTVPAPAAIVATAEKGEAIAKKCLSCHTFDQSGSTRVGPNLHGVFGRPKASIAGFAYSDALKKLGGAWTPADLDSFLTKPSAFANGTKMTFPGLPSAEDRANVIAYLQSISP